MFDSLVFATHFREILAVEVEKFLGKKVLEVGKQFDSTDSYSFLLTTDGGSSYVGKIFRFPDWPPKGKLEAISKLLVQHSISHEEILFITHQHEVFTYGWQLSMYIPGGTAYDLWKKDALSKSEFFEAIGRLLSKTHLIKSQVCGSIIDSEDQFPFFKDMAESEIAQQSFNSLPSAYEIERGVLEEAKNSILEIVPGFNFDNFSLVHDDAGAKNLLWNNGDPIMIDWVDSVWAPPLRDFATLTFNQDESVLSYIEKGYGKEIDVGELYLHQLMRVVRLAHFYFFEGKKIDDFKLMVSRTSTLLKERKPFGI